MSIKFTTVPPKSLSQAILSTDTSFRLSSITGWDGVDLTSASFGSQAFGAFISADRTVLELFEWDPSTVASTSITIIGRGLDFTGVNTVVAANKRDWPAGTTTVQLGSDIPQLMNLIASSILSNANTWTGQNIFNNYAPQTDSDPTSANDLTRLSYVQALVLGTLTTINVIVPATAGETVSAGQLCYFDDATNQWKLTDADTPATVQNTLLGIAQGSGTVGNPILNGVLLQGVDTHQTGLTDGQTMYASNTPGAISNSAGTYSVVVGISKGTTSIYFAPRFNQQITADQIAAMQGGGSLGSPSSTNKFLTQLGLQAGSEIYTTELSGGSTAYTATYSPTITALTDGMELSLKIPVTNSTTTPTFSPNGLTARTIVKTGGTALVVGDIVVGMNKFKYDATNTRWVLQTPVAIAPITSIDNNILQQIIRVPDPQSTIGYVYMTTSSLGVSTSNAVFTVGGGSAGGNAPTISRFIKLANGSLVLTHKVTMGGTSGNSEADGLCVIGGYLYVLGKTGATPVLNRYNIADLTGEQAMTVSGTALGAGSNIWSDGTFLYNTYTSGTAKKYTISGTTATSGGDTSFTSMGQTTSHWSDGTYVYEIGSSYSTYKWALAGGSRTTGTVADTTQYFLSGTVITNGGGIFKEVGNSSQIITFLCNNGTNPVGTIVPVTTF